MISIGNSIKVDGSATKEFIINAMRKDISIESAIFDLIDNSINAAEESGNLQGHNIEIIFNDSEFIIKDNCGGIKPKLINLVFKIGNESSDVRGFGVGMKRAIVKLGDKAQLYSYNNKRSFDIPFDINTWGKNGNWKWKIKIIEQCRNTNYGLEIHVRELTKETKQYIKNHTEYEIRKSVSRRYRYFLKKGIQIKINNNIVRDYKIKEKPDVESDLCIIGDKITA